MKTLLTLMISTLLLSGCVSTPPKPDNPHFAPVRPQAMQAPREVTGSIFNAATSNSLYGDGRAHRVGDIITVVLQESTSSKKSNKTSVDKENAQTIASPTVFGFEPKVFGKPLSASTGTSTTAFEGEGKSDMSNSLSGNITVTVHDVLPNGLMVVKGEKWLTLNQGDEYIRVSGLIRPQDISTSNSVVSTQLADARITYSGSGALHDSNSMGWLSKFFVSAIMPF
ncbi:flagellar basal body L-ring protein FlgH [Amphritea balenae]|uniref:Flagellar L-ring protein n=1 Tax=Amphritea balenae TaxID=452629 RepID=A0A3P1SQ09_9GAMM|nr:flagellar basal body L-ring protein FlgH [Amphritea balenae]RRC99258.1 flagellar basal body L-ring protein FlgH [Amphritea balenae]GGK72631.1 flagellar L-ring protein [Amphritea balenae]